MRKRTGSVFGVLGAVVFGLLAWQLQPQANPCYRKEAAPLDCATWKVPASFVSDLPESQITGLTSDLSSKANASTQVCGHAISSNVCPTAAEVGADASGSAAAVQSNLDTHTALTTSAHGGIVPSSAVGAANGVCALDSATKISTSVIPDLSSIYVPWANVEGTGSDTSTATNKLVNAGDSRLSDARTPTGSVYGDGNIGWSTGTSTSTATSAALSAGPKAVLSRVTESVLAFADNTTADVSTSAHGLMPKLPNDNTKFLNGVGSWVAGGGGVSVVTAVVAPDASDAAVFYLNEAYGATSWTNSGAVAGNLSVQTGTIYSGQPGLRGTTAATFDTSAGIKSADNKWEYASLSVSCWVRLVAVPSAATYVMSKTYVTGSWADPFDSVRLTISNFQLLVGTSPSAYISVSNYQRPAIAPGEWHLIAGTFDDSTGVLSFYVDGNLMQSSTNAGKHIIYGSSHGAWVIGTPAGTSGNVGSSLQDCRIADTVRAQSYWQDMSKRGHTYQPNAVVF